MLSRPHPTLALRSELRVGTWSAGYLRRRRYAIEYKRTLNENVINQGQQRYASFIEVDQQVSDRVEALIAPRLQSRFECPDGFLPDVGRVADHNVEPSPPLHVHDLGEIDLEYAWLLLVTRSAQRPASAFRSYGLSLEAVSKPARTTAVTVTEETRPPVIHSWRSAINGSIRHARIAGTLTAATARISMIVAQTISN